MTGSTFLGGVEGTGISNLVVHVTDCTLQFNHNYTMTMQVEEGDRSVLRLGYLSMIDAWTAVLQNFIVTVGQPVKPLYARCYYVTVHW